MSSSPAGATPLPDGFPGAPFAPDDAWLRTLPDYDVTLGGRSGTTAWGADLPLP